MVLFLFQYFASDFALKTGYYRPLQS